MILPIAKFFFGGVFRTLATSTAIDHFAFAGAGREKVTETIKDTAKGEFDAWVNEKIDSFSGDDPDALLPNLLKDNWGKIGGVMATLPFMTNEYTRKIAIFAAVAIALYAAYEHFTKTKFNVASEASAPQQRVDLYKNMGLTEDGELDLDNKAVWAHQEPLQKSPAPMAHFVPDEPEAGYE